MMIKQIIAVLEYSPYFLLAFAIISLWIKRSILVWGSLFILAFIMGFLTDRLTLLAIPSVLSLGVLFYLTFKESCPLWLRILCGVLASILSWALAEQQIPGFNNLKVISDVILSPNAYPYTLYLNFDKALVGLIILGFGWHFINQHALTVKNMIQVIPNALVFPGRLDITKPLDFERPWQTALKRAGLDDFRFHDLRHTAASYLAMNGASLAEIAEILGHKTLQMVKRYSHLSHEHTASVIERMAELQVYLRTLLHE